MTLTMEHVTIDSPMGKKFINRVERKAREEGWKATASANTDWMLEFRRTIKPTAVGDPEEDVIVRTDIKIDWSESRFDPHYKHHESEKCSPVMVPPPRSLWLRYSGDMQQLCQALKGDHHLAIECNRGSINSSQHGIAQVYLRARKGDLTYIVGHDTLLKDGRTLWCGSVDV